MGELEGLADLAGGGHVRAAAEVEPFALLVDLEVLALGDGVDQLDLEELALLLKKSLAFSRLQNSLVKGALRAMISRILALDLARSSGWNGSCLAKS